MRSSNSRLLFCFWPSGDRLQVRGLPPWTSHSSQKSRLLLSEVPTSPSWVQLICQSGPQNSEKHCTYLITSLFLFIEDYNSGTAIWKRCTGQGMGKRAQSCHTMSMPLSPTLHMFTNLEALRTLSFWGFMGASLCRQH